MNEPDHCHEQAIERALLALEPDATGTANSPRLATEDEATIAELAREYTEIAALLPFADEPAVPRPETRTQLLDTLPGTQPSASAPAAPPASVPATAERFRSQPVASTPRASYWRPALAAILTFCLVGLAYLAGQQSELSDPPVVVATTPASAAPTEAAQAATVEALAARVAQLENNLHMVTTIARQVYPVRQANSTATAVATGPGLNGKIFVCGQHQQWYLNVEGLEPPPSDRAYQLWFMTDEGPVPAGILDVVPRQAAELGDRVMPPGTSGFMVTLEPAVGGPGPLRPTVTAPTSDPVLVADRPIRI